MPSPPWVGGAHVQAVLREDSMTELTDYLLVCFGTLFAVLSPLATVPPFLAMTDSDTQDNRLQSLIGGVCIQVEPRLTACLRHAIFPIPLRQR